MGALGSTEHLSRIAGRPRLIAHLLELVLRRQLPLLVQQLYDDALSLVGFVEDSYELNDLQAPPLHEILECELVIDVDDQRLPVILVCYSLDVHLDAADTLVVAILVEQQPRLVALDEGAEEPALLVLPGHLVELLNLQVSEAVATPVPLDDGGAVSLILLPQLVVLVAVKVPRLL